MYESVLDAAGRIKSLEVQGARNVAITAIKAIESGATQSTAKEKQEFLKELMDAKTVLFASRETEPLMRNAIRYIIHAVETSEEQSISELLGIVLLISRNFLDSLGMSKERIATVGSKRISNGLVSSQEVHILA